MESSDRPAPPGDPGTAISRRAVSVALFLLVLGGGVTISAPFFIIGTRLPYLVLLGWSSISLCGCWLFARTRRLPACALGCGLAFLLLVPVLELARLREAGLDDGPYDARPFAADVTTLTAAEILRYREGELRIYNRGSGIAPVVAYVVEGRVLWASELHLPRHGGPGSGLDEISKASVYHGRFRDMIAFVGGGSFGHERGHAYIWPGSGLYRFYLSW